VIQMSDTTAALLEEKNELERALYSV